MLKRMILVIENQSPRRLKFWIENTYVGSNANFMTREEMRTILVVEDEMEMREAVRSILDSNGYRVLTAATGKEAEVILQEEIPDLILSDINMPGMDGRELLRQLRSDPSKQAMPMVFMSGALQLDDLNALLRSGIDGVLTKPFAARELIDAVSSVFSRAELARRESERSLTLLQSTLSRALPHEINTPLHIIMGFAQLMQDETGQTSKEELAEYAGKVAEGVKRLKVKLQKLWMLLDLEHRLVTVRKGGEVGIEAGSPLSIILTSSVRDNATLARRDVTIPKPFPEAALKLQDYLLANLIHELLGNAFDYSEPTSPVQITWTLDATAAEVTITDHGRGMTMDEVKNLEDFSQFQLDRYAKLGHGFGLSIVHRILLLVGGSIKVRSVPSEGTTVTVRLPLASTP